MKKLSLHMDDLAVESFTTTSVAGTQGTVRGFGDSTGCSYGGADYTACARTCQFECGESGECTPTCPGGTTGSGSDPSGGAICTMEDRSCVYQC